MQDPVREPMLAITTRGPEQICPKGRSSNRDTKLSYPEPRHIHYYYYRTTTNGVLRLLLLKMGAYTTVGQQQKWTCYYLIEMGNVLQQLLASCILHPVNHIPLQRKATTGHGLSVVLHCAEQHVRVTVVLLLL